MATLLAKKAGHENPIATDDETHMQLIADPAVQQFPQSGSFSSQPAPVPVLIKQEEATQMTPQPQLNLTQAGENAAQGAEVLVANDNNDWINKKWRPAMGWVYMLTCTADFVIFPILWSLLQALSKGQVTNQWQPLTLQGAGLYHIAMGAVLGIAAYGRTKEKIENKS
jgi:hypothetical protein